MKTVFIEAIDTLFFRDGRPFEVGGEANLQIPPSPSTFFGALRSAILGAEPDRFSAFKSGSDQKLKKWVGEYGDSEGATSNLHLNGPLFAQMANKKITRFFPLPRDLLIYSKKKNGMNGQKKHYKYLISTRLKPIPQIIKTNMKLPHLLVNPYSQSAEYQNVLIREDLFRLYLSLGLDDPYEFTSGNEVLTTEEIFFSDFREGIALKQGQKNGENGRLFTKQYLVFNSDSKKQMGFVIECNLPDPFPENSLLRLGGDGKAAYLKIVEIEPFSIEAIKQQIEHRRQFKVYLATPALFELGAISRAMYNGYYDEFPGFKFELMAAAIGRAEFYGGYDMVANVPKVSFPAVPAGSVYYFKLKEGNAEDVIQAFHGKCISDFRKNQGFGYAFVGGIAHV